MKHTVTTANRGCMPQLLSPFFRTLRKFSTVMLLTALPATGLFAQAGVSSVTFTQFDRYSSSGTLLFSNSSLGRFSFSAMPDSYETYYLNVMAQTTTGKEAWIVQNLPVSPSPEQEPIVCQSVDVDYKLLEVQPGTLVSNIAYSVSYSPALLRVKSPVPVPVFIRPGSTAAIVARNVFSSANAAFGGPVVQNYTVAPVIRGALQHELSADYNETADLALFTNMAPVAVPLAKDREIPGDVDEKPGGCAPGAFARSIAWLSGKHNFVAGKNPQDIYDTLQARMDTCKQYNPCMIKVKDDFLKEKTGGKGTTIRIKPVTNPADTIKKYPDCDIEVDIQQLPGENIGHMIVVVGIKCGDDGCCTITYRDDSLQGKPGGDKCVKTAKICGDSITTDKKRPIRSLIIECVKVAAQREAVPAARDFITLLPNVPNPFGSTTMLRVEVKETGSFRNARIKISNDRGAELQQLKLNLHKGINEIPYRPLSNVKGVLYCTLEVDGTVIGSQKMFVH